MFYVYRWFIKDTNETFYIGKGTRNRYKETKRRNKIFLDFYNNNNCDVEILQHFENEEDAFKKEHELIIKYKNNNQCKANLDDGGKGGCNFIWTDEMREYKSKYNPMKSLEQKERMKLQNPMKDPKVANKVAEKNKRTVVINGQQFHGVQVAADALGVTDFTISRWCKRGYNSEYQPCYYLDEKKDDPTKIEIKDKRRKGVFIDDIYFSTLKEAAAYIETSPGNLSKYIRKTGKCKGHTCKYANQQLS